MTHRANVFELIAFKFSFQSGVLQALRIPVVGIRHNLIRQMLAFVDSTCVELVKSVTSRVYTYGRRVTHHSHLSRLKVFFFSIRQDV